MAAHYDTYNYPAYWSGRDYEHASEVYAISEMIKRIKNIDKILEIGAGYGRLFNSYSYRSKKIFLTDPSAKLLKIARQNIKVKKVRFLQSKLENLPDKFRPATFDLVVMVRVLHHLFDLEESIKTASKLMRKGGYLILEFPNKRHFKAVISEIVRGNLTFVLDIFPKDLRSKRNEKNKTLPFLNYHPDLIDKTLSENDLRVLEKRSVSNIRSERIKKMLPPEIVLNMEKFLQKPLAKLNFGPSIFILAKKY